MNKSNKIIIYNSHISSTPPYPPSHIARLDASEDPAREARGRAAVEEAEEGEGEFFADVIL